MTISYISFSLWVVIILNSLLMIWSWSIATLVIIHHEMSALWVMNNTFGNLFLWRWTAHKISKDFPMFLTRYRSCKGKRVLYTIQLCYCYYGSIKYAVKEMQYAAVVCSDNWLWNYLVMLLREIGWVYFPAYLLEWMYLMSFVLLLFIMVVVTPFFLV